MVMLITGSVTYRLLCKTHLSKAIATKLSKYTSEITLKHAKYLQKKLRTKPSQDTFHNINIAKGYL